MSNKNKSGFQFSILTVLLFMAAFATWFSWYQSKAEAERIEQQLPALRNAARELDIVDPAQYAVSKLIDDWHDERKWRLFLPEGGSYKACIATEQINQSLYLEPELTFDILPGQYDCEYRINKKEDLYVLEFLVNDKVVISLTRPDDWDLGQGSTGGGGISISQQQETNKPLQIYRSRFMEPVGEHGSTSPKGPANGVLIWIEKIGIDKSKYFYQASPE